MRIYDHNIVATLVQEGPAVACNQAAKIVEYMKGAFDEFPEQEQVYVVALNRKNYAKGRTRITIGTATSALMHPREVFRYACLASATAIVLVHNHPSGDPAPSAADVQITRTIREAANILDITLLDHVIIGNPTDDPTGLGYFSFRHAGLV